MHYYITSVGDAPNYLLVYLTSIHQILYMHYVIPFEFSHLNFSRHAYLCSLHGASINQTSW